MDLIVRAVDVGFGVTKFVTHVTSSEIRCASFPSLAYPSARDPAALPAAERRKTVAAPINGLFYEVGDEVALATDKLRRRTCTTATPRRPSTWPCCSAHWR
jgi:plasmid segregation protein ParM